MNLIKRIKRLFGQKNVIYSSSICSDCQQAENFFKKHGIEIDIKKIEEPKYRKELKDKYGKVLVPTIILGNDKFVGFENNKEEIKKKLNLTN